SAPYQHDVRSIDNPTAPLVFGDGAAAPVMGGAGAHSRLTVHGAASRLLPGSAGALGFDLRDTGFHVVLDRRLPQLIERTLSQVVWDFRAGQGIGHVDFYAVHAGRPRVFDAVLGDPDLRFWKPAR